MPKTYPVRNSFNAGEVGKLVEFRDDVQKYGSACLTLENAVPLVEGGAKKMPGTYFAGPAGASGATLVGSIAGGGIPADAVIGGIYPVVVASARYDACFQYIQATPGDYMRHPFSVEGNTTSFPTTEFWADSIGTDLTALDTAEIHATMEVSLFLDDLFDEMGFFAVGYAIYYVSATPTIDTQIPPPFAVPAGQGLAWAIPFTGSGGQSTYFGAAFANGATGSGPYINATGGMGIAKGRPLGGTGFTIQWTGFQVISPPPTLTVTTVVTGTLRIGQTVTGPGIAPGTIITGYIPTETPLVTFYDATAQGTGTFTGDWQFVGTQYRTFHEPVTTALSDLFFSKFGFNIPPAATILGITVSTVNISQSASAGTVSQISLWRGGQIGSVKAPATPFTPLLVTETYGNSADLWGTVLSPAIVNDSAFGYAVAVNVPDTVRVFIGEPFIMTVHYQITTMVPSGTPGGPGKYTVNNPQTVGSETMQTSSAAGKSRLAPFQFSTEQGAVLEFSEGIVRIWEGATAGSWSLGLALQTPPSGVNYDPTTAYVAGNIALVGPWAANLFYTHVTTPVNTWTPNPSLGVLTIAAPYGTSIANPVISISFSANTSDALLVTVTGSAPNQGINIALANHTNNNNAASAIQAQIRALGTLNNGAVDLTNWTVTPDPIYYGNPWLNPPTIGPGTEKAVGPAASFIAQAINSNTQNQFPVLFDGSFDNPYWAAYNATAQLPIALTTPYLEADLFELDCSTQSADVLWVFHHKYPPASIERLGPNSWVYSQSLPGAQPGEPPYRGTLGVVKTGYSALGQNITLISQAPTCTVVLATDAGTQPFQVGDRIYINLCAGMVELNRGEFIVASIAYGAVTIHVVDAKGTGTDISVAAAWHIDAHRPRHGGSHQLVGIPSSTPEGDSRCWWCLCSLQQATTRLAGRSTSNASAWAVATTNRPHCTGRSKATTQTSSPTPTRMTSPFSSRWYRIRSTAC